MLAQMFGSCLLAYPFVCYKVGWVLSILLFIHSFVSILILMHYYIEACYYTRAMSYKDLGVILLGKKFGILIDVALVVSYYGFMTAYVIISATGINNFAKNYFHQIWNPYITKSVIAFGIMFPLTLLKSLKQISKISTIAGLIIFVFIFTVIAYFFIQVSQSNILCSYTDSTGSHSIKFGYPAFPDQSAGMSFIWLIMYIPSTHSNFQVHPIIPRLLKELVGSYPLRKRLVNKSLYISVFIGVIGFGCVGFMGAVMFGSQIKQSVLKAFEPCKFVWIDIISLCYAFVVIINFPLVLYPLKTSLVQTFGQQIETKRGYGMGIIINLVFTVLCLLLALFLETIVSIFGLFGSIAGFFYYFLMPIYCYIVAKKLKEQNIGLDAENVIAFEEDLPVITQEQNNASKAFGPKEQIEVAIVSSDLNTDLNTERDDIVRKNEEAETSKQNSVYPKVLDNPYNSTAKQPKVIGITIICIYAVICIIGVVMNFQDVIEGFKTK
ncbi:Amino_acid transporter family protein [Hexamita inflata]|uniref:Amino acid transporter family protein n=1 Tax=Hexamita inflata TaxID=28002 RepID=A0AA86R3Q9_9EUKA|nr:Amino acid transporter family protein [Hexamita inflata]